MPRYEEQGAGKFDAPVSPCLGRGACRTACSRGRHTPDTTSQAMQLQLRTPRPSTRGSASGAARRCTLLLVPTGALHTLPWGAPPSLRGRPLVVAPSLSLRLDLTPAARSQRGSTALVAGPRLRHARTEVRDLYPAATVLAGGDARAHLPAHGRIRPKSRASSLSAPDSRRMAPGRTRTGPEPLSLCWSSSSVSRRRRTPRRERPHAVP